MAFGQLSSTLSCMHMYVCVLFVLAHPGMSAILHTTAESHAYVPFVLGYPRTFWDMAFLYWDNLVRTTLS